MLAKFELDDVVTVVEQCARVRPQGRFRMEGHEGYGAQKRRR